MKYAIEHGYQFVLNMDADFSHQPKYLPALLAGMDPPGQPPIDVMIGSRYMLGRRRRGLAAETPTDEPRREPLRPLAAGPSARRIAAASFRCYRTELLAKLDFDAIRSRGYSFQEEILWRLKRLGARFGETPIVFVERQHGVVQD